MSECNSRDLKTESALLTANDLVQHLRQLRALRLAQKNTLGSASKRIPVSDPKQRQEIFRKTAGHCHLCGDAITGPWTVAHVKPRTLGGSSDFDNLLPAHAGCNRMRWFYGPEEFQWIIKLGVWFRTQIEEQEEPTALMLAHQFVEHRRRSRRRARRTPSNRHLTSTPRT